MSNQPVASTSSIGSTISTTQNNRNAAQKLASVKNQSNAVSREIEKFLSRYKTEAARLQGEINELTLKAAQENQEKIQIEGKISTNQNEVNSLATDISNLNSEISRLTEDIASLSTASQQQEKPEFKVPELNVRELSDEEVRKLLDANAPEDLLANAAVQALLPKLKDDLGFRINGTVELTNKQTGGKRRLKSRRAQKGGTDNTNLQPLGVLQRRLQNAQATLAAKEAELNSLRNRAEALAANKNDKQARKNRLTTNRNQKQEEKRKLETAANTYNEQKRLAEKYFMTIIDYLTMFIQNPTNNNQPPVIPELNNLKEQLSVFTTSSGENDVASTIRDVFFTVTQFVEDVRRLSDTTAWSERPNLIEAFKTKLGELLPKLDEVTNIINQPNQLLNLPKTLFPVAVGAPAQSTVQQGGVETKNYEPKNYPVYFISKLGNAANNNSKLEILLSLNNKLMETLQKKVTIGEISMYLLQYLLINMVKTRQQQNPLKDKYTNLRKGLLEWAVQGSGNEFFVRNPTFAFLPNGTTLLNAMLEVNENLKNSKNIVPNSALNLLKLMGYPGDLAFNATDGTYTTNDGATPISLDDFKLQ